MLVEVADKQRRCFKLDFKKMFSLASAAGILHLLMIQALFFFIKNMVAGTAKLQKGLTTPTGTGEAVSPYILPNWHSNTGHGGHNFYARQRHLLA